jgi:hypothetical protein
MERNQEGSMNQLSADECLPGPAKGDSRDGDPGGLTPRCSDRAELKVRCKMTERLLQSRSIEDQTRVRFREEEVPLWEALKAVTQTCFALWSERSQSERAALVQEVTAIKERCGREGAELVFSALKNPLQAKAIARVLQLGHNFLRTLDVCLEALLRYPAQKEVTRKPVATEIEIDWAVGGICEWLCAPPYAFEHGDSGRKPHQPLAHVDRPYSTDRNARSQISHKQIANIFLLKDTTVAELERRGLAQLRADLTPD